MENNNIIKVGSQVRVKDEYMKHPALRGNVEGKVVSINKVGTVMTLAVMFNNGLVTLTDKVVSLVVG